LDKSCIGCVTVSESGCCVVALESTVATSSEGGMRASSEDDDVSATCNDTDDDIDIASDINELSSFSFIELLKEPAESDIVAACEAFNLSLAVFSFSSASNGNNAEIPTSIEVNNSVPFSSVISFKRIFSSIIVVDSAHSSINCTSSVMTRSSDEDCPFINGVE